MHRVRLGKDFWSQKIFGNRSRGDRLASREVKAFRYDNARNPSARFKVNHPDAVEKLPNGGTLRE